MTNKATWLSLLDKRISRQTWISILAKGVLLALLYVFLQIFNASQTFCWFALGMTVIFYFLDVLINQRKAEYSMLYEQARRTPESEVSFLIEPHYDATGRKNGKADFWHVCGDWRVYAYYAFLFVLNLALLIAAVVIQKG